MPKLSATLGAHIWDPKLYWIPPRCEWLKRIRRVLKFKGVPSADRLFVYVARQSGVTVLAYWIKERPGGTRRCFITLCPLHCFPDWAPALMPTIKYLVYRLRPARKQAKEGLRQLRNEEYAEGEERRKQDELKKEWVKFIKKRDPELAHRVLMGRLPLSFDARDERVEEHLRRLAAATNKRVMITKE